jgi:septum formation protein
MIYLASQSPRRRQLLQQIGIAHELLLPDEHEDAEALEAVRPRELPADYVQRVTWAKLEAAVARRRRKGLPERPILAADTTVAIGRVILGKPQDDADAARMLGLLAGRTHRVLTAVAVHSGRKKSLALSVSKVHFRGLEPQEIAAYVASGEPRGKAGAYAIQSEAAAWISRIEGSYSGIMGLPLYETAQLLATIARCKTS